MDLSTSTDPAAGSVVLPRYHDRSLIDLMPSVGTAMGLPGFSAYIDLPPADRYVVVLVDGLGWHLLRDHAHDAPYLSSLLASYLPMTAGVPATTATSLTSLGTALPPGIHGVVGYTSRIPGTSTLLNALKWDADVDPLVWQPHPTVLERMQSAGARVSVVNKAGFEGSGLTLCSQRGVPFHGVLNAWERQSEVTDAVQRSCSVVYAYESRLDHIGHERGCESAVWAEQLHAVDAELSRLRAGLPAGTVLLVTADHGMVDLPAAGRFDVETEPDLLREVALFGGEARLRHLYCRAGAADDVAARWQARVGSKALVLTRDEAEDAGWFGQVDAAVRPRIGDVLVAGLGAFATFSSRHFAVEAKMVGFHGSLTSAEMHVPLLVDQV